MRGRMNPRVSQEDYVLAVLSTSDRAPWTPVQVQKIFFLLEPAVAAQLGGAYFNFQPYNYGPFDSRVYEAIEQCQTTGFALIDQSPIASKKKYQLTETGQRRGQEVLATLPAATTARVVELSRWLRSLSFRELVTAVYKDFPHMRARSIFRDTGPSGLPQRGVSSFNHLADRLKSWSVRLINAELGRKQAGLAWVITIETSDQGVMTVNAPLDAGKDPHSAATLDEVAERIFQYLAQQQQQRT